MGVERIPPSTLADFKNCLAGRNESTVRGYIGAFELKTDNGRWIRGLLETKWPGNDWGQMDDLTQLPEENRAEILGYLLNVREDRHSSYLKKLRAAIKLYWELALGQPLRLLTDDNARDGIRQEGPLCFFGLLRMWADAVQGTDSNRRRVTIEMWLKKLSSENLNCLERGKQLGQCKTLSYHDRDVLIKRLEGMISEAAGWDSARCKRFYADEDTMKALNREAGSITVPQDTPVRVRRDLERLRVLGRYWTQFYQGRTRSGTELEGKRRFLQIVFSLLCGSLSGGDQDWIPPLKTNGSTEQRLLSMLGWAGVSLAPEVTEHIRSTREFDPFYAVPEAEISLTWTEMDCAAVRNNDWMLAQLEQLSGEISNLLEAGWIGKDIVRTQAVLALFRLLMGIAKDGDVFAGEGETEAESVAGTSHGLSWDTRHALTQITKNLLSCWEDQGRRRQLFRLLHPALADKQEYGGPLSEMIASVSDISQDYIDILRAGAACAGLPENERRQLQARAEEAENRLNMGGERAMAAKRTDSHTEGRAEPSPRFRIAVWNQEPASDYLRPCTSSAFDSISGFGPQETQMELASLLLRSARVVLTAPQVVDNPQILGLVWNHPEFLRLIQMGRITVSLFSHFKTLAEYTVYALEKGDGFQFSGYPVFQGENTVVRYYLRYCMAEYLKADDRDGRAKAMKQAPYELWEEMGCYGDSIRLADEALAGQRCEGAFPTLGELFHQQSGWRCEIAPPVLLDSIGEYLAANLGSRSDLRQLHDWLLGTLTEQNTRSAIYSGLNLARSRGEVPENTAEEYRVLTDLLYFECRSARITGFMEHRVDAKYQRLMPCNEQIPIQNLPSVSVNYIQKPLERGSEIFTLESIVDFVRESDQLAASDPGLTSSAAILNRVICNDRSVRFTLDSRGVPYWERLAYRVIDPETQKPTDMVQEKSGVNESGFLTLERRI